MGWRQKLRIFVDFFRSRKKKKKPQQKSIKSKKNKSMRKSQYKNCSPSRDIPGQKLNSLMEAENRVSSSCDSTEPEDEVFQDSRTFQTPLPRSRFTGTSDQPSDSQTDVEDSEQEDQDHHPYKVTVTELPTDLMARSQIPSITIEESNHHHSSMPSRSQRRNPSETYSVPDSFLHASQSHSPKTPPRTPEGKVVFSLVNNSFTDNANSVLNARRPRYRGKTHNTAPFRVKYTKVYGEEDGAYKNSSTPRGLVFMCNFSKFQDDVHPERVGSDKDYENMLYLFHQMGYGNRMRKNRYCQTGYITKQMFFDTLKAFSRDKKHQVLCSCVVILMSHGSGPKTFITSDNQEVDLMEVYSILDNINCEYLKGKPKIFILQFCRNNSRGLRSKRPSESQPDENFLRMLVREEVQRALQTQQEKQNQENEEPVAQDIGPTSPLFLKIEEMSRKASYASLSSLLDSQNPNATEETENQSQSRIPDQLTTPYPFYHTDTKQVPAVLPEGIQRYSDMYSIFSTASGEVSHRDPRKGSLLIQAICQVFAEFAYHDEIDILVRKVSMYMTNTLQKNDHFTVPRQTCERTNNGLDKYFYFNPEEVSYCRHVTI